MTDAELRDAALVHLHKTTVGYINKHWTVPPAGTEWQQGLDLLAQIGQAPPTPQPPPVGGLPFRSPDLVSPITIRVPGGPGTINLDDGKDYLIDLGAVSWSTVGAGRTSTTRSELVITGGRKRVIIGGSIDVKSVDSWDDAVSLHIVGGADADQGGEFFIEGVDFPNSVNAITLSTPSLVTLQNIRIGNNAVYQHDHSHGIHPDLIQVWHSTTAAGPRLRICNFTGISDYTGLSCLEAPDPRSWEIHRTNLVTVGDGIYAASGGQPTNICQYTCSDVWFHPTNGKLDDHWAYTSANTYRLANADDSQHWDSGPDRVGGSGSLTPLGGTQGDTWTCTGSNYGMFNQRVSYGDPPGGDFVPAGAAGVNYKSPGYA
jgi:hypothetical protein